MSEWSLDRWIGIAGFVVGFGSILIALWIWRRTVEDVRLTFRLGEHRLIGPFDVRSPLNSTRSSIIVHYEDYQAAQVSKVYLAFWNAGRRTIKWADSMIQEERLRFELPEGAVILGPPTLLAVTRNSVCFEAKIAEGHPNIALLSFRFLDKDDGALIEVICGGQTTGRTVEGAFTGARLLRDDGALKLIPMLTFRDVWIRYIARFVEDRKSDLPIYLLLVGSSLFLLIASGTNIFLSVVLTPLILAITTTFATLFFALSDYLATLSRKHRKLPRELRRIPVASIRNGERPGFFRPFIEDVQNTLTEGR